MSQHDDSMESGLGAFAGKEGSLKTHARQKNLKSARVALIIAGVVLSIMCAISVFQSRAEIDKEVQDMLRSGMITQAEVGEARGAMERAVYLLIGGLGVVAIIFFILAALVHRFPLFCTVGGLILYLGYNLIVAFLNAQVDAGEAVKFLLSGIIWKVIILVGLFKGIQSAIAYQRELAEERDQQGFAPHTDI